MGELNRNRDWTAIHLVQNGVTSRPMPAIARGDGVLARLPQPAHPRRGAQCDVLAARARRRTSRRTPASPTPGWSATCR